MKRSKTAVFGIVCGLACAACVFMYLQGVRGEADEARAEALARYGGEQLEVCVAKRDIAAGETIEAEAVDTRLWVADLLPSEAIRTSGDVIGKKVSSTILSGEVLSERRFNNAEAQLDIPSGLTAVSVPAKDVRAVGGAVVAGSRADMYATGGTSTDLIASDVLILATSASSQDDGSGEKVSWVTVAVASETVQEIVSAAQKTELYFTLPSETVLTDTSETADERGNTLSDEAGGTDKKKEGEGQ